MTKPVRLTKTIIDAARPASKEVRLWDSDVKGFVLRVLPSGRKTFGLKYRVQNRQRWFTIGEYGSPWTLDQARQKAREVSFNATQGEDLQDDKLKKRKALTIADAFDLYLKEGPADRPNKRQSSWTRERLDMQNHIVPLIGCTLRVVCCGRREPRRRHRDRKPAGEAARGWSARHPVPPVAGRA